MAHEWKSPADMIGSRECVVKLEQNVIKHASKTEQAFWWGKSIYQIAYVTSEGDVTCHGRVVDRSAIAGWFPLPEDSK